MAEPGVQSSDPEEWGTDRLRGREPSACPPTEKLVEGGDFTGSAEPIDLDAENTAAPDDESGEPADVNAGAKKTAVVLGAGLVVAVVAIVAALVRFGDSPRPPAPRDPLRRRPRPRVGAEHRGGRRRIKDQAIPYTASADCPPGSTSAQALTDTTSDSAWVCVRGAPGVGRRRAGAARRPGPQLSCSSRCRSPPAGWPKPLAEKTNGCSTGW